MGFFTDVLNSAGVKPSHRIDTEVNSSQKENVVSARIIDGQGSSNSRMTSSDDEMGSTAVGVAPQSESSLLQPDVTGTENVRVAEQGSVAPVTTGLHFSEPETSHSDKQLNTKNTAQDSIDFTENTSHASFNAGIEPPSIFSGEYHAEVPGSKDNNPTKNERANTFATVDVVSGVQENNFRHRNQENPSIQTSDHISDNDVFHEDMNQAIKLDKPSTLDSMHQELSTRAHLSKIPDRDLAKTIADKTATNRVDPDNSTLESDATTLSDIKKKSLVEENEQLSRTGIQNEKERIPKINKAELMFMPVPQPIEAHRNSIETNDTQRAKVENLRPKISIGHIDVIIVGDTQVKNNSKKPGFNTSTSKRTYLGGV